MTDNTPKEKALEKIKKEQVGQLQKKLDEQVKKTFSAYQAYENELELLDGMLEEDGAAQKKLEEFLKGIK